MNGLDKNDPRVQEALSQGWSEQDVANYLGNQKTQQDPRVQEALAAGYTREEIDKHLASQKEPETSALSTALDYGARALDYVGGVARAGVATDPRVALPMALAQLAQGKVPVSPQEDIEKALVGKAPTTAQFLERSGVPEGPSLSDAVASSKYSPYSDPGKGLIEKGGMLDPTARGLMGFVGDMALDPSTYITGGVSAAKGPIAKTVTAISKPLSTVMTPVGKGVFRSGMKRVDQFVGDRGKKAVSDTLIKYGVGGSKKRIADKSTELANDLFNQRQGLLQQADKLGGNVDFTKEIISFMEKTKKAVADTKSPALLKAAKSILETAKDYARVGNVPLTMASQLKSELYQALPESTWNMMSKNPKTKQLLADMAKQIKGAIETSVEKTTGQGKVLKELNTDLGGLLTARKALAKDATQELNTPLISAVDGILAGINPVALATKKVAEATKRGGMRTTVGSKMMGMQSKREMVTDPALRRGLINLLKGEE